MALINCPECNKQVSDNAKSCPDCGFPIRDYVDGLRPEKEEVGRKKRRIDWKVIVLIFLCLFSDIHSSFMSYDINATSF